MVLFIFRDKISKTRLLEELQRPFQWDNSGKGKALSYSTTYFPLNYFPQVFGYILAKFLGFSPLYRFYSGRLFNLVCWVMLVYYSIKIIPFGKWLIVVTALTPMSLFITASYSPDPLPFGLICMFFCFVNLYGYE